MSEVVVTAWAELEGKPPPCEAADLPGHTNRDADGKRFKRKSVWHGHRPDGRPLFNCCNECRNYYVAAYGGTP